MSELDEFIWANTDYPYLCLVDKKRTEAFREAIHSAVKPGSIAVDVGSGTGIFALFAAEAGASKVYAVEIEHQLALCLRKTVEASKYKDIIEVIEGNALEVDLPKNVDVVIAEIVETGLIDEMQVPVMNALHLKGIIGTHTKVIPQKYITNLELVHVDDVFYGFSIKAPMHLWPYYAKNQDEWSQPKVTALSDKLTVTELNLERDIIDQDVNMPANFKIQGHNLSANAIRMSGVLTLTDGIELLETNSVNGEKILALPDELQLANDHVNLKVSYKMGGGLGSFKVTQA